MAALSEVTRQKITVRELEQRRSLLRRYDPINLSLPNWEGRRIKDYVIAVREFDVDQGPLSTLVDEVLQIEREADVIIIYVPEIVAYDLDGLEKKLNSLLEDPSKVEVVEVVHEGIPTPSQEPYRPTATASKRSSHHIQYKRIAEQATPAAIGDKPREGVPPPVSRVIAGLKEKPSEGKLTITIDQLATLIRGILSETIREVVREVLDERKRYDSLILYLLLNRAESDSWRHEVHSLSRELNRLQQELKSMLSAQAQRPLPQRPIEHRSMASEHSGEEHLMATELVQPEPASQHSDVFEDNPWAEVLLSKKKDGSRENREGGG